MGVIRRAGTVALVQQSPEHVVRGGDGSAVRFVGGRALFLAGGSQVRRRMPQTRVVQPQHRLTIIIDPYAFNFSVFIFFVYNIH